MNLVQSACMHVSVSPFKPFLIKLFLGVALVAVGITAGGLIPSVSDDTAQ